MKKKPKAPGWGGRRENQTGRPRRLARAGEARTEKVGTIATKTVMEALKASAEEENVSISTKIFLILDDWAATQNAADEPEELEPEQEQPDPRTQALNRLADALEKIVERVSIDKE